MPGRNKSCENETGLLFFPLKYLASNSQRHNGILKLLKENSTSVNVPTMPDCSTLLLYHCNKVLMHSPLNTSDLSFYTEEKESLAHCVKYNKKLSVKLYSSLEIVCIVSLVRKALVKSLSLPSQRRSNSMAVTYAALLPETDLYLLMPSTDNPLDCCLWYTHVSICMINSMK